VAPFLLDAVQYHAFAFVAAKVSAKTNMLAFRTTRMTVTFTIER